MPYVPTTEPHIFRDTESRALVVADTAQLERRRANRRQALSVVAHQQSIDDRLREVDARLGQYEQLLVRLIGQVSALVERPANDVPSRNRE